MIRKKNRTKTGLRQGSLTVEASLLLPVFLFATLSVIYMNKFLLYHEQVQWALTRIGREAAVEYAVSEDRVIPDQVYLTAKAQLYLKDAGVVVSLLDSEFNKDEKVLHLKADYCVKVPYPFFQLHPFCFSQQSVSRAFVGVSSRRTEEEKEENEMVYVTKTGRVYHRSISCTYLNLSISQVKYEDLEYLRSDSGSKYYACESCAEGYHFKQEENVLICDYGNRFHRRRTCSKLERSVREVSLTEVGNWLPCSKCGKKEE